MIDKYKEEFENRGVSPVIGVILLVAVTVALIALATVIVFNIGDDVGESTDATINIQETNEGISVNVIRNNNVDTIRVEGPDGSSDEFDADVSSINNIDDGSGSYSVVAVLDDGSEETIRTITVLPSDSEGILTGTASVNPNIEGATVEALDSDGNILESTITNEDGMYKFNVENIDNVNNIQDIDKLVLIIDGFEHTELDYPVYASVERTELTDEEPVDFSFDGVEEDVGGETVIVSNEIEEESSMVKTIATIEQLQAIKNDKSNDYKLIRDIDASETNSWNNGAGFEPIGEFDTNTFNSEFTGSLDGQGFEVNNLYIDRPAERDIGLIGRNDGEVKNMRMNNVYINGDEHVGGLVGQNIDTVSESYATGDVTGDKYVGGLLGRQNAGETIKSYADVSVTGNDQHAGGFIGQLDSGEVHNSYSIGDVSGDIYVGGFTSLTGSNAQVHNSYSTGSVSGTQFDFTFGFTEFNGGTFDSGEVTNSYWDSSAYTNDESEAESLSTNDMQGDSAQNNMNLDFNSIWRTVDNDYPELQWQE